MGPGLLRFLLAFAVVVHHSFPLRLGAWAVYVFFILSGYWIARMWDEKYVNTKMAPITFLCSRWLRLAPVFFTTLGLALVSSFVTPGAPPPPPHLKEWLLLQIPIIHSNAVDVILPPAWSLNVEMQFYVAFSMLIWIAEISTRSVINWLIAALALMSLIMVWHELQQGLVGSGHSSLLIYFWLFAIGAWIYKIKWSPPIWSAMLSMAIFSGITIAFLFSPETRPGIWIRGGDEMIPLVAGSSDPRWITQIWWFVGAVIITPFIAWNVRQKSGAKDRMLGNWAYPLYLFHWIPRDWYYSQLDWSHSMWRNGLLLIANVAIALLGSWLILQFIDRPLDRLRAKWVSSRIKVTPVAISSQKFAVGKP